MVLPEEADEMVGRPSGVRGVDGVLAEAEGTATEDEVGGGGGGGGVLLRLCVWSCGRAGVSWSSSSSSGLAMRRPPSERDRLKSPSII
jgi:hypothetical protein